MDILVYPLPGFNAKDVKMVCSNGTIGGGMEMTKNMRRRGDKRKEEDLGRVVKLNRASG